MIDNSACARTICPIGLDSLSIEGMGGYIVIGGRIIVIDILIHLAFMILIIMRLINNGVRSKRHNLLPVLPPLTIILVVPLITDAIAL